MKKVLVAAAFAALFFAQGVKAQTNFQTFYDFGRKHFTTTLEGFHQDDWGNTFFFIDYDYNNKDANGKVVSPSGTYFEIARCLNSGRTAPWPPSASSMSTTAAWPLRAWLRSAPPLP